MKFIGKGPGYFRDLNIEIKNRWNSKWSSVLSFHDVIIDKSVSKGGNLGAQGDIRSQIELPFRRQTAETVKAFAHIARTPVKIKGQRRMQRKH